MRAHLIVVQCRIVAEGTDGCKLHKSIKLPTAHRLLPLSPAESERSAQGLAPPLSDGLHWPSTQETTPKGPFGSSIHLIPPPPHSRTHTSPSGVYVVPEMVNSCKRQVPASASATTNIYEHTSGFRLMDGCLSFSHQLKRSLTEEDI